MTGLVPKILVTAPTESQVLFMLRGPQKNWKMALRLRPRIVKHKVSLRFVALLHVFEDIKKVLDWLRRSLN